MGSVPVGMWSTMVFDGWVGDYDGEASNGRVIINKPKTVIAEWKEDRTPAIVNSIVLAAVAAVGIIFYSKTRNRTTAKNGKKNYPGVESGGFDKFFNTKSRSFDYLQQSSHLVSKQSSSSKLIDWLLGR